MPVTDEGTSWATITGLPPSTKCKFAVLAITTVDGKEILSQIANVSVKTGTQ
jgi:hypothetical protein